MELPAGLWSFFGPHKKPWLAADRACRVVVQADRTGRKGTGTAEVNRKLLSRGTISCAFVALFLASAACGTNGGDAAASKQSTTVTTTATLPPTTTVKSGDFVTMSMTSNRGYKYRVTVSSLTVAAEPADPGFVNLLYHGRLTITNETPNRKTPPINQVTLILSYDATAGHGLESTVGLRPGNSAKGYTCAAEHIPDKFCWADHKVPFDQPRSDGIDINGSATVLTLALLNGWTAQERDVANTIAFLAHPATVVAELYEDNAGFSSDPTPPRA